MAKALTIDEIKIKCEQANITYISHYVDDKKQTRIVAYCQCGKEIEITVRNLSAKIKKGKTCSCKECGYKKVAQAQTGRIVSEEQREKQRQFMKGKTFAKGHKHSEEYKQHMREINTGESNPMYGVHRYREDNPMYGKTFSHTEEAKQLMSEQRKGKFIGELNPNYNPDKTDDERKGRQYDSKYNTWKKQVKELANNTCDCCGYRSEAGLHAHHLEDWHTHEELRYDVSNGVCLCEHCHKEFHSHMGGNHIECTEQDYLDFKQQLNENEKNTNSNVA